MAKPRQDNATDTSATSTRPKAPNAPLVFDAEAAGAAEPDALPEAVRDPDWAALPAAPVDEAVVAEADRDAVPEEDEEAETLDEPVPVTPASV